MTVTIYRNRDVSVVCSGGYSEDDDTRRGDGQIPCDVGRPVAVVSCTLAICHLDADLI